MKASGPGFTLIEMVIVVAIIALLAGILVPIAFNQVDDAQLTRALGDCKGLSNALVLYKKDTGGWPINKKMFYTEGAAATSESKFDSGNAEHIEEPLLNNSPAAVGWKGPYMSSFHADPWGHRYVIEAEGSKAVGMPYMWVISAGPDGKFDTGKNDKTLKGDDIGLILQ